MVDAQLFFRSPELFITVKEAAALLKKSEAAVRRYVRIDLLTALRVGRTLWIYRPSLEGFVAGVS